MAIDRGSCAAKVDKIWRETADDGGQLPFDETAVQRRIGSIVKVYGEVRDGRFAPQSSAGCG
jgi:hypothetical protein